MATADVDDDQMDTGDDMRNILPDSQTGNKPRLPDGKIRRPLPPQNKRKPASRFPADKDGMHP